MYCYYIFDYSGDEVFSLPFSKYDQDGEYDENDEYLFDGVEVTKQMWEDLTQRYLFTDENGQQHIRNEIDWIVLYDSV